MTEPKSTKNEPFADFTKQSYSIFSDDFCHEKLLVVKPALKTSRAILKLKQTISEKKGAYNLAQQVKLWFNLAEAGTVYSKLKSSGEVKLHFDSGVRKWQGKDLYFYSTLNTNKSLNLQSLKLGVGHDSEHCHSDNRLKVTLGGEQKSYYWYNRTMVNHGKFRFGLVSCVDLLGKVLQKNNILLGYEHDENNKVYIRAQNDGFRGQNFSFSQPNSIFDKITFDYVRNQKKDQYTIGAGFQASYNIRKNSIDNARGVLQLSEASNKFLKFGVNRYLDLSFILKRPLKHFDNLAVASVGFGVNGILKKQVSTKFGIELGLNL